MPSPFPGMDPYLEAPALWPDVHATIIATARELLAPRVGPGYFVGVEQRIFVLGEDDAARRHFVPDATVSREARSTPAVLPSDASAPTLVLVVVEDLEVREQRLVVRAIGGDRPVVAAIEVLSPANKTVGSRGREEYLSERREVLRSPAHLVEIDLLRGGARPPSAEPWPAGDYLVHVSRASMRPRGEAYSWRVRDPLPRIPVPLANGDPDAVLDLGEVLRRGYERACYDRVIDYRAAPDPPLGPEDARWAAGLLRPA